MIVLWFTLQAKAACPWAGAPTPLVASAEMTRVMVAGHQFTVDGSDNRAAFMSDLQACNAKDAVLPFNQWRSDRRLTNITAAFFPCLLPLIGTAFAAFDAGSQRELMLQAIRLSHPPAH